MVEHGKNKSMNIFDNKTIFLIKNLFFFILLFTSFNCTISEYDYDIIFDKNNNSFKNADIPLEGLVYKKYGESKIEVGYLENGEKKWKVAFKISQQRKKRTNYIL